MDKDLRLILSYTSYCGECLIWNRCINTDGYPRAFIEGDRNCKVHRVVFELCQGYLPPVVRHTCDNPLCLNPDHLKGGTSLDNVRDRVERGRTYKILTNELINQVLELQENNPHFLRKEIAALVGIDPRRVSDILNSNRVRTLGG